jgi:ABC-2 type transport system permease protein
MEGTVLTVAMDERIPAPIIEEFKTYMDVKLFSDEKEVRDRVMRVDDVPGIFLSEDGGYTVIAEGNEDPEIVEAATIVLQKIVTGSEGIEIAFNQLRDDRTYFREYVTMVLILLVALMSGWIEGFNIVEERATKAINAVSVSPTSLTEYMLSKMVFVMLHTVATVIIVSLILVGVDVSYVNLVIAMVFSVPIGILLGFVLGALTDNQISAMGIGKFFTPIFLTIPIVSIFVDKSWHWLFFIFPPYWMFVTLENIYMDTTPAAGFWLAGFITLVSGSILVFIIGKVLKRKLNLR